MRRPHPIAATNRWLRTWWPLFVSAAAVAMIITMAWVALVTLDQRRQLDEQNEQLVALVERQRAEDAGRAGRLNEAVGSVEVLLADYFAAHDENVALKLNDLLHQIAALVDRPAGTPPNPVSAVGPPPITGRTPNHTPTTTPAPPPAPPPTTAPPATTTPDQKNCAKRPTGPRC